MRGWSYSKKRVEDRASEKMTTHIWKGDLLCIVKMGGVGIDLERMGFVRTTVSCSM